jgi:2-C-methyl-D-erythritol 2,4-cyclodiphosphate synthase
MTMPTDRQNSPPYRIGQGFDSHRLEQGLPLIIGGVKIDHPFGLVGHSDADVLLHAITDALLGAAALGDIGRHFPDTDAAYRGADSRVLLREAYARVKKAGFLLGNLDATLIVESPRMAPHIAAMVANIASDLGVLPTHINVKAKTAESMGALGRQEGIAAQVVALVVKTSES